ncbi:MAG: glycosyl hydrolase family 28 protein, partial [Verrucomicrobiota bacterium]
MKSRIVFLLIGCASLAQLHANPPTLPNINTNNVFNITNYNAVGDGVTDNTTNIQKAINAAAAASGGGTVEVPAPGVFLSGPLTLGSQVNLQVDAGATLEMLPMSQFEAYPQGTDYFIQADNVTDIEISGSGTINGQGAAWWSPQAPSRPYMFYFLKVNRVLVENVTLENPPAMHLVFKDNNGNITIQGITINTPGTSPNTDGIDLVGTNCLVQNCSISDGDDNIALGSSSSDAASSGTIVTNCAFGTGHGLSIGSNTAGGVSNLVVMNCTFNNTEYGIRMKSDNASSSGGAGGVAQNLSYYNLSMTNITYGAIVIYSYYKEYGTPIGISPQTAASQTVGDVDIPIWRNIIISNLTATVGSSGMAGIIWGRMEVPVTNITLNDVNISAPNTFDVYNAYGVQIVNSQFTVPSGDPTLTIYNAGIVLTNNTAGAPTVTFSGLTSSNLLALYNTSASMTATDAYGENPITLNDATLAISNNLILPGASSLNFALGTNPAEVVATGNLTVNSTINVTNASGFGAGSYTLFSYNGNLAGNPVLGDVPAGFNYALNTNTIGQVNLMVVAPAPAAPTNLVAVPGNLAVNLSWSPSATATGYNVMRSILSGGPYTAIQTNLMSTNYVDTAVTNGVTYYYVVSAVNSGGESPNSAEVSAEPMPSLAPVSLAVQNNGNELQVSWPADHIGWYLEIQT